MRSVRKTTAPHRSDPAAAAAVSVSAGSATVALIQALFPLGRCAVEEALR